MNWFKKFKLKIRKGKKPVVQLSGKNYKIGKRLLLDIVDILNEANIDYMLDSGTLIGIAREGDILPWDDDIDISLPERELDKFLSQLWKFRLKGWWISKRFMREEFPVWKLEDYQSIKIRNRRLLFFRGRVKSDINVKYKMDDQYYWYNLGLKKISKADSRYFDSYEVLKYEGRDIKVPAHYEDYLTLKYGDWRTPDQNFDRESKDGTAVRDNSSLPAAN